eukprot:gene4610-3323_t
MVEVLFGYAVSDLQHLDFIFVFGLRERKKSEEKSEREELHGSDLCCFALAFLFAHVSPTTLTPTASSLSVRLLQHINYVVLTTVSTRLLATNDGIVIYSLRRCSAACCEAAPSCIPHLHFSFSAVAGYHPIILLHHPALPFSSSLCGAQMPDPVSSSGSTSGAGGEEFMGAIGIDLGTTFSCVSVFLHDTVEVIPNDRGARTTPSCVALQNGELLVGAAAAKLAARGDPNAFYDAKRMIGCRFRDAVVQERVSLWPFRVVSEGDEIRLEATASGAIKSFAPEQVSAEVLRYLKRCAENFLGGKRAPGAARPRQVLVFDFGGGTFDVSVISVDGSVEVRATAGDTHLGGQDLDAALVQYVSQQLEASQVRAKENPRLLARLKVACEQAKRELSFASEAELTLDACLPNGDELVVRLTRSECEALWGPLFQRCMTIVRRAVRDAHLNKDELYAIILVGGSSRIPRLAELLVEEFGEKVQLCRSIHPEEAVSIGAAVQAAILSTAEEQQSQRVASILLLDVVPLSIGVDVDDGHMDVVVPRNTPKPYKTTREYTTVEKNQAAVDIVVYEGERPLVKHNHRLGAFSLEGIAPAKRGEPTIRVTFSIDADGVLTVMGEELAKGRSRQSERLVVHGDHRLSQEQVEAMIQEAAEWASSDAATLAAAALTSGFERLDRLMRAAVEGEAAPHALPPALQRRLKFVDHGMAWLKERLPQLADKAEIERTSQKISQLQRRANRALEKFIRRRGKRQRERSGSDTPAQTIDHQESQSQSSSSAEDQDEGGEDSE